jgi:hypothetical protein
VLNVPPERANHDWFVVVRFADSAGHQWQWQYTEPIDPGTLADPPERLGQAPDSLPSWQLRVRRWLPFMRTPADW